MIYNSLFFNIQLGKMLKRRKSMADPTFWSTNEITVVFLGTFKISAKQCYE